jgi:hypothetical protein
MYHSQVKGLIWESATSLMIYHAFYSIFFSLRENPSLSSVVGLPSVSQNPLRKEIKEHGKIGICGVF